MGMSRNEDILQAIIDGSDSSQFRPPQSREEALLLQILDKISGGGGGGTGLSFHICSSDEYDHYTMVPIIYNPSETTFYLVPALSSGNDIYDEWVYVNGYWERFGSASALITSLASLSDVTLSNLSDGQTLVYQSSTRTWVNKEIKSGSEYTFSEGNTDGAFVVTDSDGNDTTVNIHGLSSICFENGEEVIIDSGNIDEWFD